MKLNHLVQWLKRQLIEVEVTEVDKSKVVWHCNGKPVTQGEMEELFQCWHFGFYIAEQAEARAFRCREILNVQNEHDSISDYADEIVTMRAHPMSAKRRIDNAVGEVSQ